MIYLPLAWTSAPLLAQFIRGSHQDPRRGSLCVCCGARMRIDADRPEQAVQCPACARWQRLSLEEETPWRLSAASAEALRRTRSWLRRL